MAYTKTPAKGKGQSKPRRSAAVHHAECSKKRSILKERIRALSLLVDELETENRLTRMHVDVLHGTLTTVVESLGLGVVLDPFGADLRTPTPDKGNPNKDAPT